MAQDKKPIENEEDEKNPKEHEGYLGDPPADPPSDPPPSPPGPGGDPGSGG